MIWYEVDEIVFDKVTRERCVVLKQNAEDGLVKVKTYGSTDGSFRYVENSDIERLTDNVKVGDQVYVFKEKSMFSQDCFCRVISISKDDEFCFHLINEEGQTWLVRRNAIFVPRFQVGDKIEAVDNYYNITTKDNGFVGEVISLLEPKENYDNIDVQGIKGDYSKFRVDDTHFEKIAEKKKRKPKKTVKTIKVFSLEKFCEEQLIKPETLTGRTWQVACDFCKVENRRCLGIDGRTYEIADCWTIEIEEEE